MGLERLSSRGPARTAAAHERLGDLWDYVAARLSDALTSVVATLEPEVRAAVARLQLRQAHLFCRADDHYHVAAALGASPRAVAQADAYGFGFHCGCVALGPVHP